MKKYKIILNSFLFLILLAACEESILDKSPQNQYSDGSVWKDIKLADLYLNDLYHGIKTGFDQETMLSCITDETHQTFTHGAEVYVEGNINADNVLPFGNGGYNLPLNWNECFVNIQKVNVFLSKIDGLVGAYPESDQAKIKTQTDVKKGEALFLRAYFYTQLARLYGGVPIMKEPNKLGDDFNLLTRASFEETVNFIVEDCDAAAALLLPKNQTLMGRATNGAALALKSRILLFAASDLTADGKADNKLVGYVSPNRTALWTAAKNAAKAVMDLGYKLEDFGAPDQNAIATNYFNFFKAKDLSSGEIIWGKLYENLKGDQNLVNGQNGPNSWGSWTGNAPTQNLVDAYEMKDGSNFFDHFTLGADGYYKNTSSKYKNINPYYNRDPRFYGTILYDSAFWRNRYTGSGLETKEPIGRYDRRNRYYVTGNDTIKTFGLDTHQGPVNSMNAGYTGYCMKKMLDDTQPEDQNSSTNVWIEFRYAEVLLNYAEACIALGETNEAATYINMIRNRAGMPNFTGDITQALHYERQIELAFENIRWYDIRRWKILDNALTDAKGVEIDEIRKDGNVVTTWKQISVQHRNPSPKMYWVPISTTEIKKAPQIVQNPLY